MADIHAPSGAALEARDRGLAHDDSGRFEEALTDLEADPNLKAAHENLKRVEPLVGVSAAIVDFGAEKQEPSRVEAKGAPKRGRKER